jgi:hypothetical protein
MKIEIDVIVYNPDVVPTDAIELRFFGPRGKRPQWSESISHETAKKLHHDLGVALLKQTHDRRADNDR